MRSVLASYCQRNFAISSRSGRPCVASVFAPYRIDAPPSRSVKDHEKENPAVHQGEFASIHDREKLRLQGGHRSHVKHEISHCHLAAREKRRDTSEQPKRNQKSADEFDNARDKCEP